MSTVRTRIYTDDTHQFWSQLGKVALLGLTLFAGCALFGVRDAILWISSGLSVCFLAALVLLLWRSRVRHGQTSFVFDGSVLLYRRCRRRLLESKSFDLKDLVAVQLRMRADSIQALDFGFEDRMPPELVIRTVNGEPESFRVLALDIEGRTELAGFFAEVCRSAGMERKGVEEQGLTTTLRWRHPARHDYARF
ncbi:hypothetical protein ACFPZ0_19005 [Streptomonospora nanhaiensis]|uniref:Uncharacterized protein n=1 Tax=Streptomonospora nanhaiensis TaxID=1323731 RepID=A0A853BL88_9ACTN|nr:hypothetical protein [Streptomonospora nanhaiensis]MBV2364753.1 hypothetical protein [Streptomonospora nanhaiensis]MBV2366733.1 hypothetical protein [Streptomonospora nanhaiensis]MBX9389981.1 hypothetical protein [Streptomonospora nanhaiensis]NYI95993.1 hypothetical protein [Streptomonospora nanhaiensis]